LISTGRLDLSFLFMTILLSADTLYGLSVYLSQEKYTSESKSLSSKTTFSAIICMDNWKNNLFRTPLVALKTAAIAVLTLQFVVSLSVVIGATSLVRYII
jgi:uncharacterized membrane protein SpoIIM required for sporulation